MIQCPACLPPDNKDCITCGGTWSVTQEISDNFYINNEIILKKQELKNTIEQYFSEIKTIEEIAQDIFLLIEPLLNINK